LALLLARERGLAQPLDLRRNGRGGGRRCPGGSTCSLTRALAGRSCRLPRAASSPGAERWAEGVFRALERIDVPQRRQEGLPLGHSVFASVGVALEDQFVGRPALGRDRTGVVPGLPVLIRASPRVRISGDEQDLSPLRAPARCSRFAELLGRVLDPLVEVVAVLV